MRVIYWLLLYGPVANAIFHEPEKSPSLSVDGAPSTTLPQVIVNDTAQGSPNQKAPKQSGAVANASHSMLRAEGPIVTSPDTGLPPQQGNVTPQEDHAPEPEKHEHPVHSGGEEHQGAARKEGSEHEEAPKPESLSLAFFLMAAVGALMVVFHFANSEQLEIQLVTWRVLNMTVSIFAAILLYGTFINFVDHLFEPHPETMAVTSAIIFLFLFLGTHVFLFKMKGGDGMQLQASAQILAHICGFAAMYGFADSQEQIDWVEEFGTNGFLLLIIVAAISISALSYVMDLAMDRAAKNDSAVDEAETQWIEQCEELDDDVFCITVSFLIVLFIRSLIRGRPAPYEPGRIVGVTQSHASALLAVSMGFCLFLIVLTIQMNKRKHLIKHNSFTRRIATIVQHLNAMITGWGILFWAEWQLYVLGWKHTVIGGCLAIAIFLTMLSFVVVLILNQIQRHFRDSKVMKRVMNSLELALGVLMGFSWERAFDVGFEETEDELVHNQGHGPVMSIMIPSLLCLGLFAITSTAWRWYILPKVDKLEEKVKEMLKRLAD